MASSELSAWDGCCTSHLQVVLLGGRNSGKSSVGNLLLGREEFPPGERTSCSRRVGAVAGRWLTVVDTPGWWCDFGARDTCELVKREVVSSASLCWPGPHAFLIALKAGSPFPEKRRRAVEEHVGLLGEEVWAHCMVVLLASGGAGEQVRAGGRALRRLSERCGQRCHSLTLGDRAGASRLLEEIRRLVVGNGNRVFEVQESIWRAAAEERRRVEERAQQRFVRMKTHRALMRERLRPVTDIRIVLLGAKGSGKTSVLNTILGRGGAHPPGRTSECAVGEAVVFGRRVTVVDTPGWWMNFLCAESTAFDRRELALAPSRCPPGPHAFLLVVRADRAFTETYGRAAREHLQLLLGGNIWSRVLVVFSFGDWLGTASPERYLEGEGAPLRRLVEECGNRYHVLDNRSGGGGVQVRELIGKVEEMLAGRSGGRRWYEPERSAVERLEGEKRAEEERAEERRARRRRQRGAARARTGRPGPRPELRLVLVGGRRSGKSSCGNTILGGELFDSGVPTVACAERRGEVLGRAVSVLDTPERFPVTSDLLGGEEDNGAGGRRAVVLLVVNVSASFSDAHLEHLEAQLEGGGAQMWGRAAVLFSHGDWLGRGTVERHIESEGGTLRRLVERCGNRYHVLDNKRPGGGAQGGGAQVEELLELLEETLQDGWRGVEVREASCDSSTPSRSDAGGQVVAAAARGRRGLSVPDRDGLLSVFASLLCGDRGPGWTSAGGHSLTVNLSSWLPAGPQGENLVKPSLVLILPQVPSGKLENVVGLRPLCRPALRGCAPGGVVEEGGLQRGDSSLEELEAFIDSYFEEVWEQADSPAPEPGAAVGGGGEEEEEEEVLSSIDRKLSKLELLEEIRGDVAQLRLSLQRGWEVAQEVLRERSDAR